MRASPPSPSRTKIVGDTVPYTRFNIPSRRAGPACPAEKCVPGGGTHGSRPTGAYPQKNNAAPLAGRRAFSVHVWHRRRRVIFAALNKREPRGKSAKALQPEHLTGGRPSYHSRDDLGFLLHHQIRENLLPLYTLIN